MDLIKKIAIAAISHRVKHSRIFFCKDVSIGRNFISNFKLIITGKGHVVIKDNVNAWAHEEPNRFHTYTPEAQIIIGENCKLNGAYFQAQKRITVGKDCIIGSALILDTDLHSIEKDRRTNPNAKVICAPIKIGNNVWIGGRSAILKGVTIGDNSVVGFGSVVTKDVPANTVVAGNPAKFVKKLP